jgi:hypothetical protein
MKKLNYQKTLKANGSSALSFFNLLHINQR